MVEALQELKKHVDRQVWAWESLGPCCPADFEEQAAWVKAQELVDKLVAANG